MRRISVVVIGFSGQNLIGIILVKWISVVDMIPDQRETIGIGIGKLI